MKILVRIKKCLILIIIQLSQNIIMIQTNQWLVKRNTCSSSQVPFSNNCSNLLGASFVILVKVNTYRFFLQDSISIITIITSDPSQHATPPPSTHAHHPRQHATPASTPPTLPSLARYPRKNVARITNASTPPMQERHPRHPRQHEQHAISQTHKKHCMKRKAD